MGQIIKVFYKAIIISSLALTANIFADEGVEEIVVKGVFWSNIKAFDLGEQY